MGLASVFNRIFTGRDIEDPETGEITQVQNSSGQEIPDPTPIAPPLGYKRQPSIFEQMRQMVLSDRLAAEAAAAGAETFEEADDFEVGDDVDPRSGWENDYDPPIRQVVDDGAKALAERLNNPAGTPPPPEPVPASPPVPGPAGPAVTPPPAPPVAKSTT